jgi:hypothetical protein
MVVWMSAGQKKAFDTEEEQTTSRTTEEAATRCTRSAVSFLSPCPPWSSVVLRVEYLAVPPTGAGIGGRSAMPGSHGNAVATMERNYIPPAEPSWALRGRLPFGALHLILEDELLPM